MQTNEQLLSAIENYLAQTEFPAEPELLYAPIGYSLAGGGKRLRPMLLMLSNGIFTDKIQHALPAAAAVEVFHNFTLLHDDIMDNAAVRRGKPSVYAKWGQNVAILSGDAMLICAYRLLGEVPAQLLPQILSTFNTMALEVCEGQQYDMDFERKPKVSVVEYMHMIELKTSVLLAGATTIGALLGGAFVTSNRESGDGRYDIQLKPTQKGLPGILIELKAEKNCSDEQLKKLSETALQQINDKKYETELTTAGVRTIYKYGVAFSGKKVEVAVG